MKEIQISKEVYEVGDIFTDKDDCFIYYLLLSKINENEFMSLGFSQHLHCDEKRDYNEAFCISKIDVREHKYIKNSKTLEDAKEYYKEFIGNLNKIMLTILEK